MNRTYVTEVDANREPPELQVMHKKGMEAEAGQLASVPGPRHPDQDPEERNQPMTTTLWAPTREELDEVTARTADAMAAEDASLADRLRAAELEEAAHHGYLQRPGADAELQRDAEAEWEAGS